MILFICLIYIQRHCNVADGAIVPTWTAVDANNVKTSKELFEHMKREGWRVEVRFIGSNCHILWKC